MNSYFFTDADGFLTYTVFTPHAPEGGTLLDFVVPDTPRGFFKFHVATRQWQKYSPFTTSPSEEAWAGVRYRRNRLIAASDWTQLPDVAAVTQNAWTTYRQALRDITLQTDPFAIVWPVAP